MCFTNSTGVADKVSYFKSINVGAVWLSPIFQSPQDDFGYDISNYKKVDSLFGTMADFNRLQRVLKENGTYPKSLNFDSRIMLRILLILIDIKLILDFVPNHTSDEHPWFIQSVNKIEPYTNYYVWKDPIMENGTRKPPNNWVNK